MRSAHEHPKWPPTLAEFVGMTQARPEDYGAPIAVEAWVEARNHAAEPEQHRWSHDAIRLAGRKTGWMALNQTQERYADELRNVFEREYLKACRQIASGQAGIGHDSQKSAGEQAAIQSDEQARQDAARYDGISASQALKAMRSGLSRG